MRRRMWGCGGATAGTVKSITKTQHGVKPCHPFSLLNNIKKKKKRKTLKQNWKTALEGSGDGRRMHEVMLPWGTVCVWTMLG